MSDGSISSASWVTRVFWVLCLAAACGPAGVAEHALEPFHAVAVSGSMTIVVERGDVPAVHWSGRDDAVTVVDGVLGLERDGGRGGVARVVTPELSRVVVEGGDVVVEAAAIDGQRLELELAGAGRVAIRDVRADLVRVVLSGAPAVTVSGVAGRLEVFGDGGGELDLSGLCVETAELELSGPARATVVAATRIDARLSPRAELRYFAPHELGDQPGKVERLADGGACPP